MFFSHEAIATWLCGRFLLVAVGWTDLQPWGGLDPPFKKPLLASSEHLTFRYNRDSPIASDPDACAELVRRIRSSAHLMPEVSELAFPEGFGESARADIEAVVRKNQLILDYEMALRKTASDLIEAETVIEIKDAEIAKLKKDALDKAKEMVAERSRYYRGRGDIPDGAGRAKRAIDRMRQTHCRELTSATSCIGAAATYLSDRFRQYMVDRDKREKKLFLHAQAFGTLESMGTLEELSMHIPKKLKDTLAANEEKFKKEMEEVTVESITEHDPRFPGLDALQGVNQFGSNIGTVDPIAASALRSPALVGDHPVSTQEASIEEQELPITGSKRMEAARAAGTAALSPVAED
ncbi:hypothetical protein DY000_02025102 [Brassica cretica]|uniref:Uncharacterized protein n=1 Tax=Brassica cretica TaxID=69181 RepID=A0ABQ7EKR3_BRACR|nr:hypothetical protein DY000_02025102 [Brassica cretica]